MCINKRGRYSSTSRGIEIEYNNLTIWNAAEDYSIGPPITTTPVKLSVGVPGNAYLLEIEGLFTHGSRPGRTVGESVGGIFQIDMFDWSNGIRYHIFDTRPDTEFNDKRVDFAYRRRYVERTTRA
jgi:hypothetical protein